MVTVAIVLLEIQGISDAKCVCSQEVQASKTK